MTLVNQASFLDKIREITRKLKFEEEHKATYNIIEKPNEEKK